MVFANDVFPNGQAQAEVDSTPLRGEPGRVMRLSDDPLAARVSRSTSLRPSLLDPYRNAEHIGR